MKSACFFVLSAVLLFIMPIGAHLAYAVEFKSVGAHPAILHDAPSERGRKIFIAPRGMPLEVILTYKEWCKVRDSSGDLSWVESKLLTPKRNVIVTATTAKIAPKKSSTITCIKGKTSKKISGINPRCPTGYKKK